MVNALESTVPLTTGSDGSIGSNFPGASLEHHRTARHDRRLHRVSLLDLYTLRLAVTMRCIPNAEEIVRKRNGQIMTALAIS